MRTCAPSWVADFLSWWIDPESGSIANLTSSPSPWLLDMARRRANHDARCDEENAARMPELMRLGRSGDIGLACCARIGRHHGAVANSRPFSHDRAIRSCLVTTRENLIAAAGPTSQSYSVANPNGSETRRHSTEPVPVGRLPRMTATARLKALLKEKGQPAPQGRREVRIAALFTLATDGACQSRC